MIKFPLVIIIQSLFYYSLGAFFAKVTNNKLSAGLKVALGIALSYFVLLPILFLPVRLSSAVSASIAVIMAILLVVFKIKNHLLGGMLDWLRKLKKNRVYVIAFSIVCVLLLFIFIVLYVTPLFGHDGKVIYFMKAKLLFEEGSKSIFEKYRLIPHNKYPMLLSLQQFLSLSLSFSNEPIYSSVIMIILLLSLSWTAISAFDARNKLLYGITVLVIYLTLPIHYSSDNGFISRYADFPLSVFIFSLCITFFITKQLKSSIIFLFSLPLIKNEGYMIFAAFILVALIFEREMLKKIWSTKINIAVMWVGISAILISILMKFMRYSPFEETSFKYLMQNLGALIHLPGVLFDSALQFINPVNFGVVNIALIVLIALHLRGKPLMQVILLSVASIVGYGVVICLIGGEFYKTSSDVLVRLNYQFSLSLIFFTAFDYQKEKKKDNQSQPSLSLKINKRLIVKMLLGIAGLILILEIVFRLFWLLFFHVPIFDRKGLKHLFYPEVKMIEETYNDYDRKIKILILGGSVLYKDYGDFKSMLKNKLEAKLDSDVEVYNAAFPAHTSLDSYYKYKMLENKKFDYVFFYHSINELRANNVPTEKFRKNYSHYSYYYLLNSLMSNSLSDFTVIPFTFSFITNSILEKFKMREYVPTHYPREDWTKYGIYIKTSESLMDNVENIANIAEEKGDRMIIGTFAHYMPDGYSIDKFNNKELDYSEYYHPVELWGDPISVNAGLILHNCKLREFAVKNSKTILIDFEAIMPDSGIYYQDICHLTEKGCSILAEYVSSAIVKNLKTQETE